MTHPPYHYTTRHTRFFAFLLSVFSLFLSVFILFSFLFVAFSCFVSFFLYYLFTFAGKVFALRKRLAFFTFDSFAVVLHFPAFFTFRVSSPWLFWLILRGEVRSRLPLPCFLPLVLQRVAIALLMTLAFFGSIGPFLP